MIYQVYTRSFADSSGDGVGDLTGIINHLDYLNELGVDVLWLSPIHQSPQHDNGYDIGNYRRIDALFGTEGEFDRLLAEVHGRGIKLIMGLVVNHTSDEHSAFPVSSSSRSNVSRDSYFWRDPRRGFSPDEPGAEPNNWGFGFRRQRLDLPSRDGAVLPAPLQPAPAGSELGRAPASATASTK